MPSFGIKKICLRTRVWFEFSFTNKLCGLTMTNNNRISILCNENWNILKYHIKDKNKLNIEFLFHLVQCFKTFQIKKLILFVSFGLMVFVKAEIDCGCLRCVFCFRNKEKERETFCNNFYSTIFLQLFFSIIPWTK